MSSIFNGERIVSSKDDVGTRGFSHVKKMMMITKSYIAYEKNNSIW